MTGFWSTTWADVATLLGLLLAFLGYLTAARAATAAKNASVETAKEVEAALRRFHSMDRVASLSDALSQLQALPDWRLPEQATEAITHCRDVRRLLTEVLESGEPLGRDDRRMLTDCLKELDSYEIVLLDARQSQVWDFAAAKNQPLNRHVQNLRSLLKRLRTQPGRDT